MADRSRGLVSVSTLHDIMSGKTKELTDSTIAGIALILQISEAQVLAALRGRELTEEEIGSEEKDRIWAMYSDIPRQCQKDVMDLLEVLQRNHSVSARRQDRRARVAAASGGAPMRMSDKDNRPNDIRGERGGIPRHPAVTETPRDVPLPETTREDLGEEEEGEDRRGVANDKNGTEN